jgi:hypothetical protein
MPRVRRTVLVPALLAALIAAALPTRAEAESARSLRGRDPHPAHVLLAKRARLLPCDRDDLECRAFTGTLAWRPDERRPLLAPKSVRRLALLDHLPASQRERAMRCLAFISWAEARSDGIAGMRAVVAVVLNRSRDPAYPTHPCGVIGQSGAFEPMARGSYRATVQALKAKRLAPFPRPRGTVDAAALQMARLLVWRMAFQDDYVDPTLGATHFVAPKVLKARGQRMPRWTRVLQRTARIGGHHFYRAAEIEVARNP